MRLPDINQVLTAASWQPPGLLTYAALQNAEDYAEFILSMYKQKFKIISGIKQDLPISEQVLQAREILKAEKCMEAACIPLISCLRLQYLRSSYVLNMYLDEQNIMDPLNSGY